MKKIIEAPDGCMIHVICPDCNTRDGVEASDPGVGIFIHCTACDKYWFLEKSKHTVEYGWKEFPQISLRLGGPPDMGFLKPRVFMNPKGIGKGLREGE